MSSAVTGRQRARTRLPADQRRAQLLAQAARLFMQRGYAGVGIDEIGAAVGISGPAVYRHVTGKEQLVTEIAGGWLELFAQRTRAAHDLSAGDARLDAMLAAGLEVALSHVAEVTVVTRYTDVATHPVHAAEEPDARKSQDQCRTRWETVVDLWAPVLITAYPHLTPQQAPDYIRLVTGLVLGAAVSEREMSQGARVALLVRATRRVLETPVGLPASAADAAAGSEPARWRRASRREQILDTAVRMFSERGYGGVSMADIAEEVGVTPSASYRHFTSKEELLATAVDRAGQRMVLSLATALADANTAGDAVDALIRTFVCDALTNCDSMAVCVTERFHLPTTELAVARKRDRLVVEEWAHALATTRPELTLAGRELLVHAVLRLVVEALRTLPSNGLVSEAEDSLVRVCHAVLDPEVPDSAALDSGALDSAALDSAENAAS